MTTFEKFSLADSVANLEEQLRQARQIRNNVEEALRVRNKRVEVLEKAIRHHRDQRGHDRCWLNDQELYGVLPETVPSSPGLPPRGEFLAQCERYYAEQIKTTRASVVCGFCQDTHRVEGQMCNKCPTPCSVCRFPGGHPYCRVTPCDCSCHAVTKANGTYYK